MNFLGLLTRTAPLLCLAAAPAPQIGFDGVPPVRVGMTKVQAEQALHAKLRFEFLEDDGPNGCGMAVAKVGGGTVSYMIEKGRITRADIDVDRDGKVANSKVRTAAGIGLGSSIADIRRAYGTRARSQPNAYDNANLDFEVKSPDGKAAMVFETGQAKVVRVRVGRLPSAEYIEGCS